MTILYFIIAAIIGYLFGSIPVGYLLVRIFKGVDLRTVQSGRTGGTNTYRAAGLPLGVATAVLDAVKGGFAIWGTQWALGSVLSDSNLIWATAIAGALSVAGHNWSLFLGFKGGAGAATNTGWATAVWGPTAFIVIAGAILIFWLIGMASVMTQAMALVILLTFTILSFVVEPSVVPAPFVLTAVVTSLLIAWSLRPNFKRILEGNERVVGPRAKRIEKRNKKGMRDEG